MVSTIYQWISLTEKYTKHLTLYYNYYFVIIIIIIIAIAIALERYTKRHNKVLEILINWIGSVLDSSFVLYADLVHPKAKPVIDIFNSIRPDIAVKTNDQIHTLELTVCHETNLVNSRTYKVNKYSHADKYKSSIISDCTVSTHTLEVTVMGFVSDISKFTNACRLPNIPDEINKLLVYSVLYSSFDIYSMRSTSQSASQWTNLVNCVY